MLSKKFLKAVSYLFLALSMVAYTIPSGAAFTTKPVTTSTSLKANWYAALYQHKLELGRRRRRITENDLWKDKTEAQTWKEFIAHLIRREGKRLKVYRDSLGKPTVGVGHLVRKQDRLKVGDRISEAQARAFLEHDARKAFEAAKQQAIELGIADSDFIIALGSVNFQLGTHWNQTFSQTWQHLMDGNYEQAIRNIERSRWARQTPVRTRDFVNAIRKVMEQDNESVAEASPHEMALQPMPQAA